MNDNNVFIGAGHNTNGPDLPVGFSMQLAQEPKAMEGYASLSASERESIINYIQNSTSGTDAKNRIADSIDALKNHSAPSDRFY